jgi:hypothetical protein
MTGLTLDCDQWQALVSTDTELILFNMKSLLCQLLV